MTNVEPPLWKLARKLQALAQNGLTFATNDYDRERYRAVRDAAAELMVVQSGNPAETFRHLFASQDGYATPKVDVRAAVFHDGKILLVREAADGLWTLPGGWADVNDSPTEAVERELREETGFSGKVTKLAAVYDRAKHPHVPPFPFHIYKLFFLCEITGGEPRTSSETLAVDFFPPDQLPPLSVSRVLPEQIQLMFEHRKSPALEAYCD
ncbi:MAG TPA: NUDIX hydrolase [Verrucomicrobiota bacterium]|nr:NUDIX hydrolase [Verrucomicrobiota bacterium]